MLTLKLFKFISSQKTLSGEKLHKLSLEFPIYQILNF